MTRAAVALRLAILWFATAAAIFLVAQRHHALTMRIYFEEETRAEVRQEMSEYAIRDTAAWEAHQRARAHRIAAFERQRELELGALAVLVIVGWVYTFWTISKRHREARRDVS